MIIKVFFCLVLIQFACQIVYGFDEDEENPLFQERFSQFHCYKHKICTPGGPKVCGYDARTTVLAYFKDICVLHMANCKVAGVYNVVDLSVCDMKYNYTITFKDELQFEPILRNTISNTTESKSDPNKAASKTDVANNVDTKISDPKIGNPKISDPKIGDPNKGGPNITSNGKENSTNKIFVDETFIRVGAEAKGLRLMRLVKGKFK